MQRGSITKQVPTKWGIYLGRMVSYGIRYEEPYEDYLVIGESQDMGEQGRDLTLLEEDCHPSNVITVKSGEVEPLMRDSTDAGLLRYAAVLRNIVTMYNDGQLPAAALKRLIANVT